MAPTYRIERDRGSKDFPQQLAVLRERWPIAFPTKHEDVRPLAMGVAREVAAAMSWSLPYTLGVLTRWKMSAVYRQAVLSHDQRIGLDGLPAETVDAEAKELATTQGRLREPRNSLRHAPEPSLPWPPSVAGSAHSEPAPSLSIACEDVEFARLQSCRDSISTDSPVGIPALISLLTVLLLTHLLPYSALA